ncbi:DUF4352 domain-containing protein [Dactylosporangium roseum]|uniref:DUF4352 domain-containing protein n=1 Tax=Dactylosporangium roseum TaxID=47989 RepID=A0ABY5Z4T2_9ACTN|nr:DUF4352 domain-containing protein [Dactylosporangium roseum]UWZ37056.1 DUF4352 domain-containing protein [Dactylosporangium roseum]
MRKNTILAMLAIPLAGLVLACGSTGSSSNAGSSGNSGNTTKQEAKSAPVTVKAGETMTLTESLFGSKTVVEITLANVKLNAKSGNQFITPGQGQFITADVTAVVKEGKASISSGDFKLVAADGTAYNTTMSLNGKDLMGSDLTPGQKTSGQIVFDAKKGAEQGGKVAIKSWLAEGDAGYWTL